MFDVIDVRACREAVLDRIERMLGTVSGGGICDASGGRINRITLEEARGLARTVIAETVAYDRTLAPHYIAQFPEILDMELVGAKVADSVEQGIRRAVFDKVSEDVTAAVAAQYDDFGTDGLSAAVTLGLAMFERHLLSDPFAPLRIRPQKVLAYLADTLSDPGEDEIKLLVGQMNNLVSELRTRTAECRHAARVIREAVQYCTLLSEGRINTGKPDAPAMRWAV